MAKKTPALQINARAAAGKTPKKPKKPKARGITRADLVTPDDTGETYEDLARALGASKPEPATASGAVRKLSRKDIVIAAGVFQWRIPQRDTVQRDSHVMTLAKAIAGNSKPLDPILVLAIGPRFYVLDGHHRLAAYDTARWTKAIPAHVYSGSLKEAHREALKRNIKDKLSMSGADKQEAAWRILKMKDGTSRNVLSDQTGASPSNISNMKRTLRALEANLDAEALQAITWARARAMDWGDKPHSWEEDQVEKDAEKLLGTLQRHSIAGGMTARRAEVVARVLEMLDSSLPLRLMGEWFNQYQDDFEALLEERRKDEPF